MTEVTLKDGSAIVKKGPSNLGASYTFYNEQSNSRLGNEDANTIRAKANSQMQSGMQLSSPERSAQLDENSVDKNPEETNPIPEEKVVADGGTPAPISAETPAKLKRDKQYAKGQSAMKIVED